MFNNTGAKLKTGRRLIMIESWSHGSGKRTREWPTASYAGRKIQVNPDGRLEHS